MIEDLKKEMKNFGFNDDQINRIFEIIHFIGVVQDVAWREGEGVLREDISIEPSLLNYLKQGIISEMSSLHGRYPIYKLDNQGKQVFNEISNTRKKSEPDIRSDNDYLELNKNFFSIVSFQEYDLVKSIRDFEQFTIHSDYGLMLKNSEKGALLKSEFDEFINKFKLFINNNQLYLEITPFQSNKRFSKRKIIYNNKIIDEIEGKIKEFQGRYKEIFQKLNNKFNFYSKLISSIDFPEERKVLDLYETECRDIIDRLSKMGVTTVFSTSTPYFFKIINSKKFQEEIEILKQSMVDRITDPIINVLLKQPINQTTEPSKTFMSEGFNIKEIFVGRGGNWKIEGNQSVFYYKVKLRNNFPSLIANLQIIFEEEPPGLQLRSKKLIEYPTLFSGSEVAPTYKLYATDDCVGNELNALVKFKDHLNNAHFIQVEPLIIKYVCNLLKPVKISRDEFEKKTQFMESNQISMLSDLSVSELESIINKRMIECNFAVLERVENLQNDVHREIEGFAQGLYDKQDVALSIIINELKEGVAQLEITALSEKVEKNNDILRDMSIKLDDVKNTIELIEEYAGQIEDVLNALGSLEDIELYLKEHLASDWEKIKRIWEDYKSGKLKKIDLIKEGIKIFGRKFIKVFTIKVL